MSVIDQPVETELPEIQVLDPVDDILLKVERYIRTHGWVQDQYETDDGSVCLVGALARVTTGKNFFFTTFSYGVHPSKASLAALNRLELVAREKGAMSAQTFNDNKAKSVEDIYTLLREARSHGK